MSELDDEFIKEALAAEAAEKERQANRNNGGFAFEEAKYSGLEKKVKLYRFLGPNWDHNLGNLIKKVSPFEARVARIASILDDKGKKMRLILPLRSRDDGAHPITRLIAEVLKAEWDDDPTGEIDTKTGKVKRIKTLIHQKRFPDLIAMIQRSRIPETDNRVKIGLEGSGWNGKEFLVANVIDRSMLAWHRENKHSVILSKNVNPGKPSETGKVREFADPGVPAFGFAGLLNQFRLSYGSWENFDYAIERTGQQTNPYLIFNANIETARIRDAATRALVGPKGPLSEEEAGWERYDLDKICGLSTYNKIWNRLQKSILQVDAALGTRFAEEVKAFAEQEVALRKANAAAEKEMAEQEAHDEAMEQEADPTLTEGQETLNQPAGMNMEDEPVVRVPTPASVAEAAPKADENLDPKDREKLPGWDKLKGDEKAKILSAYKDESGAWNITYSVKARGKCGVCQTRSPETYEFCPGCGSQF